jgi:hypothetical protein
LMLALLAQDRAVLELA